MNFQPGDKVQVVWCEREENPGWGRSKPQQFTATLATNPNARPRWFLVIPDDQHTSHFGGAWFCHPDWLQPIGGPW